MTDTDVHDLLTSYAAAGRRTELDLRAIRRTAVRRRRVRTSGAGVAGVGIAAALAVLVPGSGPDVVRDVPATRPQPPSPAVVPVPRQVVKPTGVAQLSGPPFADATVTFDPPSLAIGKDLGAAGGSISSAALAFPAFTTPGECLGQVLLVLPVSSVSGPAILSVYPSAALSLARGAVPPAGGGGPQTLLDNRPKGTTPQLRVGQNSATFDITELARLWADGAAFPSKGRAVPKGTPLVLLVRPDDAADGTSEAEVPAVGTELVVEGRC